MSPHDPLTPYGNRPMVTPIVSAVNYEYVSFEVLRQITDGEIDGYTYHRDDNPTVRAVEHEIAALEGAPDCVLATSGMATLRIGRGSERNQLVIMYGPQEPHGRVDILGFDLFALGRPLMPSPTR